MSLRVDQFPYTKGEVSDILKTCSHRGFGVHRFTKALNQKGAELQFDASRKIFKVKREGFEEVQLDWNVISSKPKSRTFARAIHWLRKKLNISNYRDRHVSAIEHVASKMLEVKKPKSDPESKSSEASGQSSSESKLSVKPTSKSSSTSESSFSESALPVKPRPVEKKEVEKKIVENVISYFSPDYIKAFRKILGITKIETLAYKVQPALPLIIWIDGYTINIQPQEDYGRSKNKLSLNIDDRNTVVMIEIEEDPLDGFVLPEKYIPYLKAWFCKSLELTTKYKEGINLDNQLPVLVACFIAKGVKHIAVYHLDQLTLQLAHIGKKTEHPSLVCRLVGFDLNFAKGEDVGAISREFLDDLMIGLMDIEEVSFKRFNTRLAFPVAKEVFVSEKPMVKDELAKVIFSSLEEDMKEIFGDPKIEETFNRFLKTIWSVESRPSFLGSMEKRIFSQMGQLMMFCYSSLPANQHQGYSIGRRLDPSLFQAVFSLSAEEINTPFEKWEDTTIYRLSVVLVDALLQRHLNSRVLLLLKLLLPLLKWKEGDLIDDEHLLSAWDLCGQAGFEAFSYFSDEFNKFDLKKVRGELYLSRFIAITKKAILTMVLEFGPSLGSFLAPVHAIAQGMKIQCKRHLFQPNDTKLWNQHFYLKDLTESNLERVKAFDLKLQGSLDRKEIVSTIKISKAVIPAHLKEVTKKMQWLQEWLMDEAEVQDIEVFLKCATGHGTLTQGAQLTVVAQKPYRHELLGESYRPIPSIEACFNTIAVSPVPAEEPGYHDKNKEAFIKGLKEVCLANGGGGFTVK